MQTTPHILMIRPVNFTFNEETAVNNAFQQSGSNEGVHHNALNEFDEFVNKLRAKGVDVMVVDDTLLPHTPDSIFPNNWISFHENGAMFLYPMFAKNRRLERKPAVIEKVKAHFGVTQLYDLSSHELQGKYLEGTGSMVLDRDKKIAYACLSPRTDKELLHEFCRLQNYQPVTFTATDKKGNAIYHTNVMMCIADSYIVICLDCFACEVERKMVEQVIQDSGKEIIPITTSQMSRFAGNMLQVQNASGKKLLVMSTQAYESLNEEQVKKLEQFNEILHSPLYTIESNGGGSARCMMAEVHLPGK